MGWKKFQKRVLCGKFGKLVLREVQSKDAVALNKVINEPRVNEFMWLIAPVSLKSTREKIATIPNQKNEKWIAAELNCEVVGSIDLKRFLGRGVHVTDFGISFSRKVRGKGVALAAFKEVFSYLRENGVKIISSRVFADNPRARTFYKKLGFREIGVLPRHVKKEGKYVDQIIIIKTL
jgi:RimJ/RimL family protein N-acetyltransferase